MSKSHGDCQRLPEQCQVEQTNGRILLCYVSRDDLNLQIDRLAEIVTDRPDLIAKGRKAVSEFADALGLTKGVKADKKKFLELVAAAAVAQASRVRRGEKTITDNINDAYFDILDQNHDGHVTLDEYKVLMKVMNFPLESAEATFNMLDKNKNGKLERQELNSAENKFWYILDDTEAKGMFGKKF